MPFSKADIHIHTIYSYGSMSPSEVVDYVYFHTDLRVICITDHDSIQGGMVAQEYLEKHTNYKQKIDVVVGAEIKSCDGHILGLFLTDNIEPSQTAINTIRAIHAQGGIAIAAHPYAHWFAMLGMRGVGSKIRYLPFNAIESRNSSFSEIYTNYLTEFLNHKWQRLPKVGGSDSYIKQMIGRTYTYFEGRTKEDLYNALSTGSVQAGGFVCSPWIMLKLLFARPPSL